MDFYALLGVTPDASADAIDRAYRRLARRYHPGVNPGDRAAEDMFRQVQEAYRILGQLDRRREYDRGQLHGPAEIEATLFAGFDFSRPAEGAAAATFSELFADVFQDAARQASAPRDGAALEAMLEVSFEDAVQGGAFRLSINRQERCVTCAASGRVPHAPESCPSCGGAGGRRWARGHMVFTKECEACDGSGRLTSQTCPTCGGIGIAPRSEVVTVSLPPGLDSGARIVVPGRGHTGAYGGPPGDLYVQLQVAEHRFFRRAGRDIYMTLPIAVHEAALGARVEVPTLNGPVKLRIPPGATSGDRLRLRGQGVPSTEHGDPAGDLIAEVQIAVPPVRDERSKELLREFARLNAVDVRAALFGPVER